MRKLRIFKGLNLATLFESFLEFGFCPPPLLKRLSTLKAKKKLNFFFGLRYTRVSCDRRESASRSLKGRARRGDIANSCVRVSTQGSIARRALAGFYPPKYSQRVRRRRIAHFFSTFFVGVFFFVSFPAFSLSLTLPRPAFTGNGAAADRRRRNGTRRVRAYFRRALARMAIGRRAAPVAVCRRVRAYVRRPVLRRGRPARPHRRTHTRKRRSGPGAGSDFRRRRRPPRSTTPRFSF